MIAGRYSTYVPRTFQNPNRYRTNCSASRVIIGNNLDTGHWVGLSIVPSYNTHELVSITDSRVHLNSSQRNGSIRQGYICVCVCVFRFPTIMDLRGRSNRGEIRRNEIRMMKETKYEVTEKKICDLLVPNRPKYL